VNTPSARVARERGEQPVCRGLERRVCAAGGLSAGASGSREHRRTGRPWHRALPLVLLAFVGSCNGPERKDDPEALPPVPEIARGTVGAYVRFSNIRTTPVVGYGLVIGLEGTGSQTMPANLRRRLLREMYRGGISDREATKILESPNTAACLVRGTVMPFHTRGSRFDVEVIALPGTQTKSLKGGTLVKTGLGPIVRDVKRRQVMGSAVGVAHGPVVVGAAAGLESKTRRTDPRRGRVIGGGRFRGDRRLTLELRDPNLRMCLLLEEAINSRFPRSARADSRQIIGREAFEPATEPDPGRPTERVPKETQYLLILTVPRAYAERWLHFAQVVASLYLDTRRESIELRVRYLIAKLRDPELRVSACYGLEALGQTSVEPLASVLNDADRDVRISAASVLSALGDPRGTPVLVTAARDRTCPQRTAAIGALGRASDPTALQTLTDLAAAGDLPVRLAAYEALRRMPNQAVVEHIDRIVLRDQQYEFRRFGIDLVHTKGAPLIVANAANDPRLIFFGDDVRFKPPIFFDEGRYWAIAKEHDTVITVQPRKPEPRRPLLRAPIEIPLDVLYYVVVMDKLGATYPDVLDRLQKAEDLGRITGRFILRKPEPEPVRERRLE